MRAFQQKHGLKVDGVINPDGETERSLLGSMTLGQAADAIGQSALAIQSMGRNGDAILAHISPDEALLLDAITDGASVNPHSGLLEFYFDASQDHKNQQAQSDSAFGGDREGRSTTSGRTETGRDQDTGSHPQASTKRLATNGAPRTVGKDEPAASDTNSVNRRRNTVLTPHNDPSFSAEFFTKNDDTPKPNASWRFAQAASSTPPASPKWTPGANPNGWVGNVDKNGHFKTLPSGKPAPKKNPKDMTDEEQRRHEVERYLRGHQQRMMKEAIGAEEL